MNLAGLLFISLGLALYWHLAFVDATRASGKSASASSTPSKQEQRLAGCRPAYAPVPVALPDLPDDGPRFDRSFHGPESPLFEEIFVAYRCQDLKAADAAVAKLAKQFPNSPLLPAGRAFAAELLVAGKNAPPERRSHHSQADAINAYRVIARDYPETPNAIRAMWRIGDLYALMDNRPEAQAAYERVLAVTQTGYDAERALLGVAVNFIAWGHVEEGEESLEILRRRAMYERIVRYATLTMADLQVTQKRYKEAQALYEAAFNRWPAFVKERPISLLRYADTQEVLGQEASARQLLTLLVNLYPGVSETPMALVRLGDTYRAAGEHGRAGMFYSTVIRRYPKTEGHDLARMRLAELGQEIAATTTPDALEALEKSLAQKPDPPLLKEADQRQVFQEVAGKYKEAGLGNEALFHLAQHHERNRDVPAAVQTYKELMDREGRPAGDAWPQTAAHRLLVMLSPLMATALKTHDDVTAVTLYHQFGPFRDRLFAGSPLLVGLADAHRRVGLTPAAIQIYQTVLEKPELHAMHEAALFGLGQSYLEQKDFAAARQTLGRYGLKYPYGRWRAEALHARAIAFEGEHNRSQVIATCRQWLEHFSSHPARAQVLLLMARAQDDDGHAADAIRSYGAADQAGAGGDAQAMLRLADLLSKANHPNEALSRYEQVIAVGGNAEQTTWARLQMARILRDQKRYAEARVVLEALEHDPSDALSGRMAAAIRADLPLAIKGEGG